MSGRRQSLAGHALLGRRKRPLSEWGAIRERAAGGVVYRCELGRERGNGS